MSKREMALAATLLATTAAVAGCTSSPEKSFPKPKDEVGAHARNLGQQILEAYSSNSLQPGSTVFVGPASSGYKGLRFGRTVEVASNSYPRSTVYVKSTYPNQEVKGFKDTYTVELSVAEPSAEVIVHPQEIAKSKIASFIANSFHCNTVAECKDPDEYAHTRSSQFVPNPMVGEWEEQTSLKGPANVDVVMASVMPQYGHDGQ